MGLSSEEIPLAALLSKFNMSVGENLPISQIAYLGTSINYLLIGSLSLFILFVLLLFLLTENGKRFISLGLPLLLIGLIFLFLFKTSTIINLNLVKDVVSTTNMQQVLLRTIAPGIIESVSKTWLYIGIIFVILGILLLFFKKPSYTNST